MMLDIFLSDTFMLGVICTVLFLLVLVIVVPATTRSPERLPRQREWRVIEPAEQLPTVQAKRIEAKR
jgi:hypothetical protein